jgi:DNA-directed RNA polymerase specialized sigma24 family protein
MPCDPQALWQYRDMLHRLAHLALARLQPRLRLKVGDASDIVDETFAVAIEAHDQCNGQPPPWLRKILLNEINARVRFWQRKKRNPKRELSLSRDVERSSWRLEELLAAEVSSASKKMMWQELLEIVEKELALLPDHWRMVVELRDVNRFKFAEIVAHMQRAYSPDSTDAAVVGWYRRAHERLRERLANKK